MIDNRRQFVVHRTEERSRTSPARLSLFCTAMLLAGGLIGCSGQGSGADRDEPPLHFAEGYTVAVAPALNFSGSPDFDPVQVADLMASELSGFEGVGVIGVNRVLAVLADHGTDRIESPQHALEVASRIGADSILVFAVTEYDAYTPVVGLAAQLYGRRRYYSALDPVAASRMARPFEVEPGGDRTRPYGQTQRVFNAESEAVRKDVLRFAKERDTGEGPYGAHRYLKSQRHYLRYCCHTIACELMQQIQDPAMVGSVAITESGS